MHSRLTLGLLFALIVAHVVLAAAFAVETPYRTAGYLMGQGGQPSPAKDVGAPDERQHVNYISHLATAGSFPVFQPNSKDFYETYQSHQMPLFYVLGDVWSKVFGISDFESADSGIKLRSLNVVIGSATVAGVFFLLYWGFSDEKVALVGAAFSALLPMNVALSGAVSNDPLLFCLCTWDLALLTLAAKQGWPWKRALAIGVVTGFALLTKTTALALIPVILLALVLKGSVKPQPKLLLASAALALLMVAPWWARNVTLYHDPFALKAFSSAFTGSAQKTTITSIITMQDPSANPELSYWKDWVGWWTARSFVGVFGYMDIWLNEHGSAPTGPGAPNTIYRLMMAFGFLCAVGWLASLRGPQAGGQKIANVLNGAFFVVVVLLFIRFNNQYFQAQARYLLPAIGPVAGGVALGLNRLLSGRTYAALAIVFVVLGGLDLYALSILPQRFEVRTKAFLFRNESAPMQRVTRGAQAASISESGVGSS